MNDTADRHLEEEVPAPASIPNPDADVLDRLAYLEYELQCQSIRTEHSEERRRLIHAHLRAVRHSIREIQQLRGRLNKIHRFTRPEVVGPRERPLTDLTVDPEKS